jgi:hypothetical protein
MPSPSSPDCATNVRSGVFKSARYGFDASPGSGCLRSASCAMVPPVVSISARYRSVVIVIVRPAAAGSLSAAAAAGAPGTLDGATVAAGDGGKSAGVAGFEADVGAGSGGGACCFCQASQRSRPENEKTTRRMRRWVSMNASLAARPQAAGG